MPLICEAMNQTICVCGAGTMGSGIAQVSAQSGFPTILYDVYPGVLEKAATNIEKSLQSLVEKRKLAAAEKERHRATNAIYIFIAGMHL